MQINIAVQGTSPLLMHNERLSDPLDPFVKQIKTITGKKTNQTDDDRAQISKLEWRAGLYLDPDTEDGKVIIYTRNIIKCLVNAAAISRAGKRISRGLITDALFVPLFTGQDGNGPRTIKELWPNILKTTVLDTNPFVDRRQVGVNQNRISRTRPIFPHWRLSASFEMLEDVLNFDELKAIIDLAGRAIGLGDARIIGYGRFKAEVTK